MTADNGLRRSHCPELEDHELENDQLTVDSEIVWDLLLRLILLDKLSSTQLDKHIMCVQKSSPKLYVLLLDAKKLSAFSRVALSTVHAEGLFFSGPAAAFPITLCHIISHMATEVNSPSAERDTLQKLANKMISTWGFVECLHLQSKVWTEVSCKMYWKVHKFQGLQEHSTCFTQLSRVSPVVTKVEMDYFNLMSASVFDILTHLFLARTEACRLKTAIESVSLLKYLTVMTYYQI
ncbi:hypothetical protein BTVI_81703 [Pitangus sulphuratus]|nr:hypothetical protein BTVI_81703 [Pitangus sulphuratus]